MLGFVLPYPLSTHGRRLTILSQRNTLVQMTLSNTFIYHGISFLTCIEYSFEVDLNWNVSLKLFYNRPLVHLNG